ncbi:MAG: ABC transporter substrate-binding protein [Chloroflexi bacterium]|nr:ABC transporter substrate-binding protein [Chloroflexota bacterium]
MKNHTRRPSLIILLIATLVLSSCGPAAAPTPTSEPGITGAPAPGAPAPATPAPAAPIQTLAEKPKYGGTISLVQPTEQNISNLDSGGNPTSSGLAGLVFEGPQQDDRTRGPFGTGEFDFGGTRVGPETQGPGLAESWTIPAVGTWIFKVRQDVHWALDTRSEASRLVNGREMTPEDWVFHFKRTTTNPSSWIVVSKPLAAKATTVEITAPWEVTLKTPVEPFTGWCWLVAGWWHPMIPPEVIEKYGSMKDWQNAVGTGPFMVSDYVPGNVMTLTKNRNYWDKDPIGPGKGNQLPYADTLKYFVIADLSTRLATMRTGRVDWMTDIQWEDGESLLRTAPNLKYRAYNTVAVPLLQMRMDNPELPFTDKRVRQALTMAIDFQTIKNDLYGGQAVIGAWPVTPAFTDVWVSMEKRPEAVQALYKYNPEKAKELLAEAGYPNGFKTELILENRSETLDLGAIIAAMWAKVGVSLELQPKESAVFRSISGGRTFEKMLMGTTQSNTIFWSQFNTLRGPNSSYVNGPPGGEPVFEATFQEMQKSMLINPAETARVFGEFVPYLLEQAYYINFPAPNIYTFWQPWLKGYAGELEQAGTNSPGYWFKYIWLDQELKLKMTGRR